MSNSIPNPLVMSSLMSHRHLLYDSSGSMNGATHSCTIPCFLLFLLLFRLVLVILTVVAIGAI